MTSIATTARINAQAFAQTLSYSDLKLFTFLQQHGYDLDRIRVRLMLWNVPARTAVRERKKYADLLFACLTYNGATSV